LEESSRPPARPRTRSDVKATSLTERRHADRGRALWILQDRQRKRFQRESGRRATPQRRVKETSAERWYAAGRRRVKAQHRARGHLASPPAGGWRERGLPARRLRDLHVTVANNEAYPCRARVGDVHSPWPDWARRPIPAGGHLARDRGEATTAGRGGPGRLLRLQARRRHDAARGRRRRRPRGRSRLSAAAGWPPMRHVRQVSGSSGKRSSGTPSARVGASRPRSVAAQCAELQPAPAGKGRGRAPADHASGASARCRRPFRVPGDAPSAPPLTGIAQARGERPTTSVALACGVTTARLERRGRHRRSPTEPGRRACKRASASGNHVRRGLLARAKRSTHRAWPAGGRRSAESMQHHANAPELAGAGERGARTRSRREGLAGRRRRPRPGEGTHVQAPIGGAS